MGVVIETCIKSPGGPTRNKGTDVPRSSVNRCFKNIGYNHYNREYRVLIQKGATVLLFLYNIPTDRGSRENRERIPGVLSVQKGRLYFCINQAAGKPRLSSYIFPRTVEIGRCLLLMFPHLTFREKIRPGSTYLPSPPL
jgi:hypothetical protein